MNESLVIIPTYNEKENIERLIRKIFTLDKEFHVLIVDDNSPDGTASIIKRLMKEFDGSLFIEERKGKQGLGTAYIHGFKWALENNYDYIFEMDADLSHNPEDLPRLYNTCAKDGAELAIGSRYISGVNVVNWPIGRILMSYFASKYVRIITGLKIKDTTAGFKCFRKEVLESIDLNNIRFRGYAFQIEMKFIASKLGFNIVEIPIIFTDRTKGKSKMNSSIFNEAIFGVISLKLKSLLNKYPKKKINNLKSAGQ